MKKHSDPKDSWDDMRAKIIGLGDSSIRKSYYPQLKARIAELERFRALMDSANDAIFLFAAQTGRIIYINQAASRQMKSSGEEILDRSITAIFPQLEKRTAGFLSDRHAGNLESKFTFHSTFAQPDGDALPVEVTFQVVFLNGEAFGVIVARDISTRTRFKEALSKSEQKYCSLVENIPDVIWTSDQNGNILFITTNVHEVLGYSVHEILSGGGFSWFEKVHPDDLDRVREGISNLFAGQQVFNVDYRIQKKDDSWIWVNGKSISTYWMEGKMCADGIISDITRRKQMERQLKHSEQRLNSIIKNVPDIIYRLDADGRITFISDAIRKYGYEPRELIGRKMLDLIPDKDKVRLAYKINERRTGDRYTRSQKVRLLPRQRLEAPAPASPPEEDPVFLVTAEGLYEYEKMAVRRFIGTQGIARDVSERERVAREKRFLEGQLKQAQKLEAIGTLAGGIAHDFNNILAAIVGYTEITLFHVGENTKARDSLEKVLKATERAKELIQQILSFSRQTEQEKRPLQISLLVKEVLKLLRASLPTTIAVREKVLYQKGIILADPIQIHQVLMNLCTNSLQAMQESGGELVVGLEKVEMDPETAARHPNLEPGRYVRIMVRDNGPGIDPAIMDRIFEPYFTTRRQTGGTGLGLAMVHGIVQSHGGAISVTSEPGKGTTFYVYFPEVKREYVAREEIVKPVAAGHERILVVDDEKALVEIIKDMLERLGYTVFAQTSSLKALEMFREAPQAFDLVITDMTMPGMTGDRLALEFFRLRPDIPVILCTGYSEQISEEKARKIGINKFLMKPLVIRELAETVRSVLDASSAGT